MARRGARKAKNGVRLVVWAQPGQEALVEDAVRRGGFELVAMGPPEAKPAADLGDGTAVRTLRNLREAIRLDGVDLLWLAAPQRLKADQRRLIRESGVQTISSEPIPGNVGDLLADPREADTARFVPRMRQSPGYRAASELLDQIGPPRCVDIFLGSGPGYGTLFARLFDAMDLIETLCGGAQVLDASLGGRFSGVPETLGALRGHLTVNVRFPDQRCVCATVSDQAGCWYRSVTILGEGGCLRIKDHAFELISPDGIILDAHRERGEITPGVLIATEVGRRLKNLETADPPADATRLLALCEAARLSCRTGAGESPDKVLAMLKRV